MKQEEEDDDISALTTKSLFRSFISITHQHNFRWRLLAEAALEPALDFAVAEKAFVRCLDYTGVQFVKRLRQLNDKVKQKAEVAAYFQRFEEAEALYREIDRKDLAIDLRVRLGDWFRVIALAGPGGAGASGSASLDPRLRGTGAGVGGAENKGLLVEAWGAIGDYYFERSKYSHAAQFYSKARKFPPLADCHYALGDYDALWKLGQALAAELGGSPGMGNTLAVSGGADNLHADAEESKKLLSSIADKLVSVGLGEQGARCHVAAGDVRSALDACIILNEWTLAVELAQQEGKKGNTDTEAQVEELLKRYAQKLTEQESSSSSSGASSAGGGGFGGGALGTGPRGSRRDRSGAAGNNSKEDENSLAVQAQRKRLQEQGLAYAKKLEAVQLYRKANRHYESSKLLSQIAADMGQRFARKEPHKLKKVYLVAALEIERKKEGDIIKTQEAKSANANASGAAALANLMSHDAGGGRQESKGSSVGSSAAEKAAMQYYHPWRGCEAYHLYLLCQKQVYEGAFDQALKTAIRLTDYDDILNTETIYALVALTAYHTGHFLQCSKAFIKLEHSSDVPEEMRRKYERLAVSIFKKKLPRDGTVTTINCGACNKPQPDWATSCTDEKCGVRYPFCVATGQSLINQPVGVVPANGGNAGKSLQDLSKEYLGSVDCKTCRRKIIASEAIRRQACPLCHCALNGGAGPAKKEFTSLPPSSAAGAAPGGGLRAMPGGGLAAPGGGLASK